MGGLLARAMICRLCMSQAIGLCGHTFSYVTTSRLDVVATGAAPEVSKAPVVVAARRHVASVQPPGVGALNPDSGETSKSLFLETVELQLSARN